MVKMKHCTDITELHHFKGTQGIIFKCQWKNKAAIIKKFNDQPFALELESHIWDILKKFKNIHFCKIYDVGTDYIVFKQITCEKIFISLSDVFFEKKYSTSLALNCIFQTLAAVIMYEKKGITHYDLHGDNVLIQKTIYDIHVYKIGDFFMAIETFGLTPVIIDFGLACLKNFNWLATFSFLKEGYTTFLQDTNIDSRFLLFTCLKDGKKRKDKTFSFFSETVKSMFSTLYLSEETGRLKKTYYPDLIKEITDEINLDETGLFSLEHISWTLDVLHAGILLPLTEKSCDDSFFKLYTVFSKTWKKYVTADILTQKVLLKKIILSQLSEEEMHEINVLFPFISKKHLYTLKNQTILLAQSLEKIVTSSKINTIQNALYSQLPYPTTQDILFKLFNDFKSRIHYKSYQTLYLLDVISGLSKKISLTPRLTEFLNINEDIVFKKLFNSI